MFCNRGLYLKIIKNFDYFYLNLNLTIKKLNTNVELK